MSRPVWFPTQEQIERSRLYQFMKKLGFDNVDAFHQHSIQDIASFWDEVVQDMGLMWDIPYQQVMNVEDGMELVKWFDGGKFNLTTNCLDRFVDNPMTRNQVALIWEGEDGRSTKYTYRDLWCEVNRFSKLLTQLGVTPGDRIVLYLPMIAENVIAMLSAARIGAICVPCFSGFKAAALTTRIQDCGAKIIITADGFWRRGKLVTMKAEADQAADMSPTIEKVIIVKRLGCYMDWQEERDIDWKKPVNHQTPLIPYQTDASDPFMILYTSGTTGKPKGTVHTHTGFPIKAAFDAGYGMDVGRGDILFWATDMGWMMGPWMVFGSLLNGSTMLIYEGTPDYPTPDHLWAIVEKYGVTHLGISPTIVRSLMRHGNSWLSTHDIDSLRVFGSTGEPWNLEPWHWLFEKVGKKQIPIFNYAGGTEISGGIMGNLLIKPQVPCGFNALLPGMDADILDGSGRSVHQVVGELVIRQPWVGMTNRFWQDTEKHLQTYWGRWDKIWVHGDWVRKDKAGHWFISGRSDDTIIIAGKRIGPAELESVLVGHPLVMEACAIGIPDSEKGEVAICFVVLHDPPEPDKLEVELIQLVAGKMGSAFRPKQVHVVQELPKTKNGKIIRRIVRSAYLGESLGDLSALKNTKSVEMIRKSRNSKQRKFKSDKQI